MWAAIAGWFVALGAAIWGAVSVWVTGVISALAVFSTWTTAIYAVLVIVIGINLYNLVAGILNEVQQWVLGYLNAVQQPGGLPATALEFVNLAGYLAEHLKFYQCISFAFNCIALKWLLVKVPLVKW